MTHDPDMQKEAIIAHQKLNGFESAHTLAGQFQSIMYAPDYTMERRAQLLMSFAWQNRLEITEGLRLRGSQKGK